MEPFFLIAETWATGALLRRNPVSFQLAVQVAALKADGLGEPCDVAAAFVEFRLKIAGLEHGPGLLEIKIRVQHRGLRQERGFAGGGSCLLLKEK